MSDKKTKLQIAPSGKITINERDAAETNIKAYYDDPENVVLPPHQEAIRERFEAVYGMLLKGKTEAEIVKIISTLHQISPSQVRRDIKVVDSILIPSDLSFQIRRKRAVEMSLETYRAARKKKDLKNMNAAIRNLIDADGLKNEPADTPFENLILPPVVVVLHEKMNNLLENLINQVENQQVGKVNISDFFIKNSEKAQYEED